jgi:hypothetical protein
MELKTARLTLLIDPDKKAAFERLCAKQDRTASQVVRQLIREYLALHGVEYQPGGSPQGEPPSGARQKTVAQPSAGSAAKSGRGGRQA